MARTFAIHPPLAGLNRAAGLQSQPDYSTPESINYWSVDVRDGRQLTATRPPLRTITANHLPVNLFQQINVPTPLLFMAANGVLSYTSNGSSFTDISSSVAVSTGRPVYSAPFFRKIVIANTNTPLLYDHDLGTMVELVATAGFVPTGCRLAANFQDRVWLGGSPLDELGPHVFAACAADDVHDWDFSRDSEQAAYISTGDDRGLITEPLTALLAFTADQMLMGCEEQLWILTGNPRAGGRFDRVSEMVGVLGQQACVATPMGLFFLSHDGFMQVARNNYNNLTVTPISKQKIPNDLLAIDFDSTTNPVTMAYDSRWNSVILCVRDSDNPQWWRYALQTGGFEQMELPIQPLVMCSYTPMLTDDRSDVLFGGQTLRQFDRNATESITARQIIGPVKISSTPMEAALVKQMSLLFGGGTTDSAATVEVYTAGTAEVAVNRAKVRSPFYKYATTTGTLKANNRNCLPMLRGHAIALRIDQTTSTGRVVFENAFGLTDPGGVNLDNGQVAPVIETPAALPLEISSD